MANKKGFVRYANNKLVAGSLILADKAPKVGVWKEVPADLCCDDCKPIVNEVQNPLSFVADNLYYNATTPCFISGEPSTYIIVSCYNKLFLFTISGNKAIDGYYHDGPSGVSYQVINGELTFYTQCA
jgi:hypothetical protein